MGYEELLKKAIITGCEDDAYDLVKYVEVDKPIGPNGLTALHIACMHGSWQMVVILLDNEADPFVEDGEGKTPLQIAIDYGGNGAYDTYTNCALLLSRAMGYA